MSQPDFEAYIRRGEAKKAHVDGMFVVPPETEAAINRALRQASPMRSIATVVHTTGAVFKRPRPDGGETSFPTMELYAMPAATQTLLDDSAVDIDQWIAEEVRLAFATQEGQAFVTGDGNYQPKGFLAYGTVPNDAWKHGMIGFVSTGVAGAFPAGGAWEKLTELVYAVKAHDRALAHFVMNRATLAQVRKIRDADGNYAWMPAHAPGAPSTLLRFPVIECEGMPDIGPGSFAIAFGNFKRGYLIVDRVGISVLRDPYSAKPYVLFYTTKRVGGGVQDFDAIKLLKFGE